MGQAILSAADGRHETAAAALERMVPADVRGLPPGRQRYTQLINAEGGIIDDLMVCRLPGGADDGVLHLVVNAARNQTDLDHIRAHLLEGASLEARERALLALQGPAAVRVMETLQTSAREMKFMTACSMTIEGCECIVSRSGYTGEDGFEISTGMECAETLWKRLLADERVAPIGLGARDTLRLEAGLCLYGHDIDETTSPVEAGLAWSIGRRRLDEGGFPGADRISREMRDGAARRRVGILLEGRAPAREGTEIRSADDLIVGRVTSGTFGPTVGAAIAMAYVNAEHAGVGTSLRLMVRGKALHGHVVALPFVPHRYAGRA
jgi:aminomethyltransferase